MSDLALLRAGVQWRSAILSLQPPRLMSRYEQHSAGLQPEKENTAKASIEQQESLVVECARAFLLVES